MKLEDVRVGMKVVPHSKGVLGDLGDSIVWRNAQERQQPYLYVSSIGCPYVQGVRNAKNVVLLETEQHSQLGSDYFLPEDFEQWCDANDAPEGYYAVAQKNCTECDLRGHVECIQARCDESVRGDECPVIFKQRAFCKKEYSKIDTLTVTVDAATAYAQGTIRQTEPDPVNNPSHYTNGEIECIDAIKSAITGLVGMEAFCTGQIIKYSWRWKHKNGKEDLEKARYYINKLIEEITVEK